MRIDCTENWRDEYADYFILAGYDVQSKTSIPVAFCCVIVHADICFSEFLNSDNAFNVTSIDLLDSRSAEGYNVHATVAFRNPSPYNVDMVSERI